LTYSILGNILKLFRFNTVLNQKRLMNYWLLKTEPGTYSWDDLVKKGMDMWDGVRNFRARSNLKKIKTGDISFFYHSGKEPGIVGLVETIKEHYPDPTDKSGVWVVVEVKPLRKLKRFVGLHEIKKIQELHNMVLVKNSRLSVQPVTEDEFNFIVQLSEKV